MKTILLIIFIMGFLVASFGIAGLFIPVYKLGIPLFNQNVKWTWFIYRNLKKMKKLENEYPGDSQYFKVDDKIVVFYDSWLFEVYQGETIKEIRHKYDLGGQSNKAEYLTWWQKIIGGKIEKWYLTQIN